MGSWIRKWHVVLAVVIGLYLAIPKTEDPLASFGNVESFPTGSTFTNQNGDQFTIDKSVRVERDEIDGKEYFIFAPRDVRMLPKADAKETDPLPTTPDRVMVDAKGVSLDRISSSAAMQLKIPLAAFKPNLGQDLAGGTSLRYRIASGDVADAQSRLYEIFNGWKSAGFLTSAPADFRTKVDAYLTAKDNGKLGERPGSNVLPTEAEVNALESSSDVISKDQLRALRNVLDTMERLGSEESRDLVKDTINLLQERLNKSGMTELNIIKAGDNEIEVKLPALAPTELDRIKATLRTTGRLEFVLLPSEKVFGEGKTAKDVYPGLPEKDAHRYRWYDVDPAVIAASLRASNNLTYDSLSKAFQEKTKRTKDSNPAFNAGTWAVVTERPAVKTRFTDKDGKEHEAWVTPEACLVQISYPNPDNPEADLPGYPIKGTSLKNAEASSDHTTGQPAVSFELKGEGVGVMSTITKAHTKKDGKDPRHLAVAIDRKLYSAPTINSELSDRIQVSGSFTRAEVKQYVSILKSGSLSVELMPLGEESIGPAEGADNINRGLLSLLVGAGLVLLFAVFFYRRTGVLTMANLILTVVLILAIMSLFLSTLTLPGIAGLVLTLGMAIDANILINERIREEREAGASGRTAIELGFKKAFSAIIDGNVTTLITALILTKVGSGAVAGFALTLSIGILCTLYTALVVYRTTIFFCYDKGIIKEVNGANLFRNTNYNILGVGKKLAIVNLILMLGAFGFFVFDAQDGDIFGVDFRGGTQVITQLNESKTRDEMTTVFESLTKAPEGQTPKYKQINLQARNVLGDENESGVGSTRWEVTVPMPAGENLDGQAAIERRDQVLEDIRIALGDLIVEDGYQPSVTDPLTVDFEINLRLARPINASTESSTIRTWLQDVTDGSFVADGTEFKDWFGSDFGDAALVVTSSTDTIQEVRFSARNVSVKDQADAEAKWLNFHRTIADKFKEFPAAAKIVIDGVPEFNSYAQSLRTGTSTDGDSRLAVWVHTGRIKAKITLLRPLTWVQFRDAFNLEARASTVSAIKEMASSLSGEDLSNQTVPTPLDAVQLPEGADPTKPSKVFYLQSAQIELFKLGTGVTDLRTDNAVDELETVVSKLDTRLRDDPLLQSGTTKPFPKASMIGGRVAGETQARALLALIIALIAIVIYIGIRFKSTGWGMAAVAALIHDTCFTLGAIAVIDWFIGHEIGFDLKIDLNAIAALLTVIGYSLNDTIVIFDRIREELVDDMSNKKQRPLGEVINAAINRTLSRTVLTSLSTFVVVLAMVFLGGPAIRTFAWTLLFGLIFGTYSSIFRAGPFLLFFTSRGGDLRSTIEAEETAKAEAKRAEEEALAAISTDREVEAEKPEEFNEADFTDAKFGADAEPNDSKDGESKA